MAPTSFAGHHRDGYQELTSREIETLLLAYLSDDPWDQVRDPAPETGLSGALLLCLRPVPDDEDELQPLIKRFVARRHR